MDQELAVRLHNLSKRLDMLQQEVKMLVADILKVTDKLITVEEWIENHEEGHPLPSEPEVPTKKEIADW